MDIYKERIKPLFDRTGLLNKDLEKEIGIPEKKISDWNAGRLKSYDKYIPQIASYFHVSTDYLLGKTDNPALPEQKESPPHGGEPLDPVTRELLEIINESSDDERETMLEMFKLFKRGKGNA